MLQLLLRADDLGYSEAVNYGIVRTVRDGLIRNIGLMPNMSAAQHGVNLLKNSKICLGLHANICVGAPVSNPTEIPSLVDENGMFKSSRTYRSAEKDFVDLDQVIIEIEAQYTHFKKLTGQSPDYFDGHAVRSANFIKGLEYVAQHHGLKYSSMGMPGDVITVLGHPVYRLPMNSMAPDYDAVQSIKAALLLARQDMPNLYVCHPGYLDAYLLRTSSLTTNRTKEVEMLCNPSVKEWLKTQAAELITYNQIRDNNG